MSKRIIKHATDPDRISLIFPTRGRVPEVRRLLESLAHTTVRKDVFDVWAYVDADDQPTLELFQHNPYPFEVNAVSGPRTDTQGEMYNRLREACTRPPGLYMVGSDKITFATRGWDDACRRAYDAFPDRMLFAYPRDTINQGRFGAFFMLSSEWANVTGRLLTDYFPFWYDDTWANDVGALLGRSAVLDFDLTLTQGPTWRMQNLYFWERFYGCTLPERIDEADLLRRSIVWGNHQKLQQSRAASAGTIRVMKKLYEPGPERDKSLLQLETHFSARLKTATPRSPPSETYRKVEDRASAKLLAMVQEALAAGRTDDYRLLEDALHHSSAAADLAIDEVERLLAAGDIRKAVGISRQLIQRFPHYPEGYCLICDGLVRHGMPDKGRKIIESAATVFPGCPDVLRRLGDVRAETGDRPGAEAAYRAWLDAVPDDPDAMARLQRLLGT